MGSGLPGSLPSYLLYHLLLYISYSANKIVVVVQSAICKSYYVLALQISMHVLLENNEIDP